MSEIFGFPSDFGCVSLIVSLVAVVDVASVLLCTSVFGINTWD